MTSLDAPGGYIGPNSAYSEPTLADRVKAATHLSPTSTAAPDSPPSPRSPRVTWAADSSWSRASSPLQRSPSRGSLVAAAAAAGTQQQRLEALRVEVVAARKTLEYYMERDWPPSERSRLAAHLFRLEADINAVADDGRTGHFKSQDENTRAIDAFEERVTLELNVARQRDQELTAREEQARQKEADVFQRLLKLEDDKKQLSRETQQQELLAGARARFLESSLREADMRHADEIDRMREEHAKALQATEHRSQVLEMRNKSLEDEVAAASEQHADSLHRQQAGHDSDMQSAEQRCEELARRTARLEEALASALTRADRAEELNMRRCWEEERLRDAEGRAMMFEGRVEQLERELQAASSLRTELQQEAAIFRTRGDHLEEVSNKLRSDLQDERIRDISRETSPVRATTPRAQPLLDHVSSSRMGPHELRRLTRSRQLRRDLLNSHLERTALPPSPRSLPLTPRSTQELHEGLVPDRTAAISRYNHQGRLISYDAYGRAV